MDFQAGDKVSFINEKQDGFIVAIKANGICVVEIEDGFTLDATASELVKIKDTQQKKSDKKNDIGEENLVKEVPPIDLINVYSLLGTVALITLPDNGKVLSGKIDYWLVNGSDSDVLYAFSSFKSKMPEGIAAGYLEKNKTVLMSTILRDAIIDIDHLQIQLLFHKKGLHQELPRINKEFKIELPTITQHYPKLASPYSFALVNTLINFSIDAEPDLNELFEKYKEDYTDDRKNSKPAVANSLHKKADTSLKDFGLSGSSLEVDLHIEELIDDPAGMSAAEMIDIQLRHFRKELDNAMYKRSVKIIFIHGVGNGRLKNSIRSELKTLKLNYRDGAYDRFGAGATEVLFR